MQQRENSISAKLTFKPTSEVLFQLKGGYNYTSELTVSHNDSELNDIEGATGFYSGMSAYWRFKK